jgi:hypothetical protein
MPEWWGVFLAVVVGAIVLAVFIGGLVELTKYVRKQSVRFRVLAVLSLLVAPSMLTTCTAINRLSTDEKRDAFGLGRPDYEVGGATRGMRRERLVHNTFTYITSAHGLASMGTAIVVSMPFLVCLRKILREVHSLDDIAGYWRVAVPLGLVSLVLFGRS